MKAISYHVEKREIDRCGLIDGNNILPLGLGRNENVDAEADSAKALNKEKQLQKPVSAV